MSESRSTRSPAARDGPPDAGERTVKGRHVALESRKRGPADDGEVPAVRNRAGSDGRAPAGSRAELELLMDQLREANENLVLAHVRAQTLAERAGHLAAIVESTGDAIYSRSLQGIITSWNKAAEQIFGYTESEAVGSRVTRLVPAGRLDEMPVLLERLSHGETIDRVDTVRVRKDGTHIDVSLTVSPVRDDAGGIVAAAVIARDITERRLAEQERAELLRRAQEARSEAENANRLKDEFLATVSHELRTPLNAVLGWARMVTSGRLEGLHVAHALGAIERNATALAHIIDDLLDLTRIAAGKLDLAWEPVDLVALVREAFEVVRPLAADKQIALGCHLEPGGMEAVDGDAGRLQQVIGNLLTNAIKFTPEGGRIDVSIARVDGDVQLAVRDTGQGIEPAFLPHVFERFRQGDAGTMRQHRGLGLGLAIVRQIVDLHSGRVEAASEGPGRGATFTVRLPLPSLSSRPWPANADRRGQGAGRRRSERMNGVRVMVVDPDRDGCALTVLLLRQAGASVHAAGSAREALRGLELEPADVLVTGIGLPDEDGYALLRRLREQEAARGRFTPAIALTAYGGIEDRRRLHAAGFQAHVVKPFEPAELMATIRSFAQPPSGT